MELVKLMEWNFFAAEEPPAHNQQQKQLNFSSILFTSFNQLLWLKGRKNGRKRRRGREEKFVERRKVIPQSTNLHSFHQHFLFCVDEWRSLCCWLLHSLTAADATALAPRSLIPLHWRSFIDFINKLIPSINSLHSASSTRSLSLISLIWMSWLACFLLFAEHCGVPPPLTRNSKKATNSSIKQFQFHQSNQKFLLNWCGMEGPGHQSISLIPLVHWLLPSLPQWR